MEAIFTIGHSTRTTEELVDLLRMHDVELLVDVRRWPTSSRHPHFDREALDPALDDAGIDYRHEEVLGGFREPESGSPNRGWKSDGFRGYADHLHGDEPRRAVERLLEEAKRRRLAIMCAELVPWRCHRQILADVFTAAGARVIHVLDRDRIQEHELRHMARRLEDGRVVYPAPEDAQAELFGES